MLRPILRMSVHSPEHTRRLSAADVEPISAALNAALTARIWKKRANITSPHPNDAGSNGFWIPNSHWAGGTGSIWADSLRPNFEAPRGSIASADCPEQKGCPGDGHPLLNRLPLGCIPTPPPIDQTTASHSMRNGCARRSYQKAREPRIPIEHAQHLVAAAIRHFEQHTVNTGFPVGRQYRLVCRCIEHRD